MSLSLTLFSLSPIHLAITALYSYVCTFLRIFGFALRILHVPDTMSTLFNTNLHHCQCPSQCSHLADEGLNAREMSAILEISSPCLSLTLFAFVSPSFPSLSFSPLQCVDCERVLSSHLPVCMHTYVRFKGLNTTRVDSLTSFFS